MDLGQDLSNHLFFALVQSFGREFNGILPNHTLHYTLTDSQVRDPLYTQLVVCVTPRAEDYDETLHESTS